MNLQVDQLFEAFESGSIDGDTFGHREHVIVAYETLERFPFEEALQRYSAGIRKIASAAGVPEKYNTTITMAFLALIDERRKASIQESFEQFIAENEDLLQKDVLSRWYSKSRLASDFVRTSFALPDKIAQSSGSNQDAETRRRTAFSRSLSLVQRQPDRHAPENGAGKAGLPDRESRVPPEP